MKTIKQWFESVENPILRKVLLMRLDEDWIYCPCKDLPHAVFTSTTYSPLMEQIDSKNFWECVYTELIYSNESLTFNAKYPVMQVEWLDENECIRINTLEEAELISKLLNKEFIKNSFIEDDRPFVYFPKSNQITDMYTSSFDSRIIYPAKLFIKDMKQDLLEEAKIRFPIGCIIKKDDRLIFRVKSIRNYGQNIFAEGDLINKDGYYQYDKGFYGFKPNQSFLVYHLDNQWAEYVEVFGFKVGDVIPFGILNKWSSIKGNLYEDGEVVNWIGNWYKNRTIEKIGFINNTICFQMSDSFEWSWIKAEGLREFIELEKLKQDTNKAEKKFIDCLNEYNQNNMKIQTLTLGQLKDLYKGDTCPEWRSMLLNYLEQYNTCKDDYKIEIKQSDLDYAKQHASKVQLKLLQDAGLVFEEECPYKVNEYIVYNKKVYQIKKINNYPERSYLEGRIWLEFNDKDETSISYEYYKDKLRKATPEEIKYVQIDWDKLKTGSVVMIEHSPQHCRGLHNIDVNQPVNIVFYKTKHLINAECLFVNANSYDSYITFEQNGKFVTFGSHINTDYIKEVISY